MTSQQAENVANILIGVAVTGAAFYLLADPARRRSVWRSLRRAMVASGPWLFSEVMHAWAESGRGADVRLASPVPPDARGI